MKSGDATPVFVRYASMEEMDMNLGKLGVWSSLDGYTAKEALAFAQRVEKRGYPALWVPESRGRDVLVASAYLLGGTTKLIIAPGIANI
jgi:alkanesulfonate monooxygenase SsuD/methylene tetrahydromethanopterin reductase-like flavin-dependent oxidoreductase (luciferase family)